MADLTRDEIARFRLLVDALRGHTEADVDVSVVRATHHSGKHRAMVLLTFADGDDSVKLLPVALLLGEGEIDDYELETPADIVEVDANSLLG